MLSDQEIKVEEELRRVLNGLVPYGDVFLKVNNYDVRYEWIYELPGTSEMWSIKHTVSQELLRAMRDAPETLKGLAEYLVREWREIVDRGLVDRGLVEMTENDS